MKRVWSLCFLVFVVLFLFQAKLQAGGQEKYKYDAIYGTGEAAVTVATGSPGVLGLLKALAAPFCQANSCRIRWTKKGSGASLSALRNGEVDMIMVHAPAAEKKAVKEGWATMHTLLGSNEFYIVGPESDPAGIRKAESAEAAYAMIAKNGAKFFSRGDNSGTHRKEMKIWKLAGIKPGGSWYTITRDFMGPTLMRADRERGYFMTDSSTFFVKRAKLKNLRILFKGDPVLVNIYHALVASPEKYPRVNYVLAARFVKFIESPRGQEIYRNYGKKRYGAALYNDAEYARQWEKE
jgi:tungstate transport system substrate-binding protein